MLHMPALTQKEMVSYWSFQHVSDVEWFLNMKKFVHLMNTFNDPTTIFFRRKLKER